MALPYVLLQRVKRERQSLAAELAEAVAEQSVANAEFAKDTSDLLDLCAQVREFLPDIRDDLEPDDPR